MTATPTAPAPLTLGFGEVAVVPVPEGRLVLSAETGSAGHAHLVARLHPHGAEPHELARAQHGGPVAALDLMTLALAALDAWR